MNESRLGRRAFLGASAAGLASLAFVEKSFAAAGYTGYQLGSQSYSFRNFSFPDSIAQLKGLGLANMEFCSVHFKPDAADPGFATVQSTIAASGIKVLCYGVEEFTKDDAANRKKFEFAKALGIGVLTANPDAESFSSLDALCEEFKIKIAIHNHGPKARYDKVTDTLKAVEGHHPFIGACVDTGHVIRSGEKPHEVIAALGPRVHSLHLKDWVFNGKEQILGKGDMDLAAVATSLKALGFTGPLMVEYEESPDNPVPDMKIGLENWTAACKAAK